MAKTMKIILSGDLRNPSGPCISHACNNFRSFFGDTVTFYGETESGEPISLEVKVQGYHWHERGGHWWEVKGHIKDEGTYQALIDTETKMGEIVCHPTQKAARITVQA